MAVSIVIPTYNESGSIGTLLQKIHDVMYRFVQFEIVIVDDDSQDGTEQEVEDFKRISGGRLENIVFHKRLGKRGLGSAILEGIRLASHRHVIVMDADLSHPPDLLREISRCLESGYGIVIASRHVSGGRIEDWPLKRRIISSGATWIARLGLNVPQKDPMSGYFGLDRNLIKDTCFDAIGYKLLLEVLVKRRDIRVKEIPFVFRDRQKGSSKLGMRTMLDFVRSVWRLYRYGQAQKEQSVPVRFLSKAARFFTVGASGLGVNLAATSAFLEIGQLWHIHANIMGILISMTSNFVLNKVWTFEERDIASSNALVQYSKFVLFSSAGASLQLLLAYYFEEMTAIPYYVGLTIAVLLAGFGNFLLNKQFTFRERIWS